MYSVKLQHGDTCHIEILYQQCTNQPLFQDDDSPEDMKRGSCKLLMCVGIKLCGLVTLILRFYSLKEFFMLAIYGLP